MKEFLQVALLSLVAGASAMAGPITIDSGTWTEFGFSDRAGPVDGSPFTFTALSDVFLSVTDGWLSGDRFVIAINNNVFVGLTSFPGSFFDQIGDNYDAAFADPRWSSASYLLGPGVYSVGIAPIPAFGRSLAALRVDSAIPEPATFGLLGVALLGVGIARRKLAR